MPSDTATPERRSGEVAEWHLTARPMPEAEAPYPTQAAESSAAWPVHTVDRQHFARHPDGTHQLITLNGQAGELPPGWSPVFIYAGFEPLYLLELTHESGTESTWFLDQNMSRIGFDNPADLQPFEAGVLRLKGPDVLRALWNQLLCERNIHFTPEVRGFLRLGNAIRKSIGRFCEEEMNMRARQFDLDLAFRHQAELSLGNAVRLRIDRLRDILVQDLIANLCASIPTGTLRWASPIGDGIVETDHGLWLDHYVFAYRLIDGSDGPITYLLVSSHPTRVIGIYFPGEHILFHGHVHPSTYLAGVAVERAVLRHICEYAPLIEQAWREPARGFSALFTSPLISAQIWHDLSGIDRITRDVPPQHIPEILGMWGLPEVYGDTEELYPEARGRVNRAYKTLEDLDKLIRYAYSARRCLLRMTHTYVTKNLYLRDEKSLQ